MAHLTAVDGSHYYAACLTFYEAVAADQLLPSRRNPQPPAAAAASGRPLLVTNENGGGVSPVGSLSPLGSNCEFVAIAAPVSGSIPLNGPDPNLVRPTELFAPKCIVLLARHQHFEVLQVSRHDCFSLSFG